MISTGQKSQSVIQIFSFSLCFVLIIQSDSSQIETVEARSSIRMVIHKLFFRYLVYNFFQS